MDRLIASNSVPLAQADTAPVTGTPQYATDGNPATNLPATLWPAYAFNALQDEIYNVIVAAGLTPNRSAWNQLLAAIKRIGQNTLVLADTGAVNAYTAANATPLVAGTWVDGVMQAVKIAHTNTGASTYAPDGLAAIPIYGLGLQPLQGNELLLNGTAILMHATIAGVNGGSPICVLMECAGGTQQVPALYSSGKINGVNNPNLLFNGSGEFGSVGWALGSFSQFVDTSGEIGSFFSNSGALAAYTFAVAGQQVPIGAGQNVCLSMDVSNGASGTVQISLAAYTSGGSYIANIGTLAVPNSSLTRYFTTASTPANTAYVVPQLVLNGVTSTAFGIVFRRVKVEQGTTPSLYSQEASIAALNTGRLLNIQVFAAAGTFTYTPTAGTNSVIVDVHAGSGGGGSVVSTGASQVAASAGGGGGGFARSRLTSGFAGVSVVVGAAGPGGTTGGGAGGTGGSSSFGALLSATGGSAGAPGAATSNTGSSMAPGGQGGTGTGGNLVNRSGVTGGNAVTTGSSIGRGAGGPSGGGLSGGGDGLQIGPSISAGAGINGQAGYILVMEFA